MGNVIGNAEKKSSGRRGEDMDRPGDSSSDVEAEARISLALVSHVFRFEVHCPANASISSQK